MSASTRRALVPSFAASLVLGTPAAAAGQSATTRPASIALTVVIPDHPPSTLTSVGTTVRRQSDAVLDVEAEIGITNRRASRIEVRLGSTWSGETARVLVQNSAGEFQLLAAQVPITAAVTHDGRADTRLRLKFRLESNEPIVSAVAVPVEYRVTVGEGDQIAVWTFPAALQIDDRR